MNKKIKIEIALGIIITVVIIIASLIWLSATGKEKKVETVVQPVSEITENNQAVEVPFEKTSEIKISDSVYIPAKIGTLGKRSHIYLSQGLGIQFSAEEDDIALVLDKDGFIRKFIQANIDPIYCKDPDCITINDKFYRDNGLGGVKILHKSSEQTFQQAIESLIRQEGKNPKNCEIIITQGGAPHSYTKNSQQQDAHLDLPEKNHPSQNEIFLKVKKEFNPDLARADFLNNCNSTPECFFAETMLTREKVKKLCSSRYDLYVARSGGGRLIYDPESTTEKLAYTEIAAEAGSFFNEALVNGIAKILK